MSKLTGFIEEGFRAAREAVEATIDRAQLHLKPETITKRLAQYVRSRIRMVETILRRLVVLLAAEVDLTDPAPTRPGPTARTPRKPAPRGFQLFPRSTSRSGALDALRARETGLDRNCTAAGPLLDRLKTLTRHLEHPAPLARRMARMLNAAKANGELRPVLFAQRGLHRLGWELALIAQALPLHANDVLREWFSSG